MLPYNHGSKKLYAGAAVWGSSPSIDIHRNLVFIATGNLYRTPDNVTECEQNRLKEKHPIVPDPCVEPDDHSESVLALDLENGTIRWSHSLGGYDTWNFYCLKPQNSNCPPIPGTDADFGEAPALHTIWDDNVHPHSRHDLAIVGQKNGFIWALDRDDGHIVWAMVAGPGGGVGGANFGLAIDSQRVYTNIANANQKNFTLLPSSEVVIGGGWVAMDVYNGTILWSTAAPNGSFAYGPVTIANGVMFAAALGTPLGALLALEATTGKVLWQYEVNSTLAGGVSVVKGCVYMGEGITLVVKNAGGNVEGSLVDAFCLPTQE
jgi:outer membrane protein assembly factor BamB